MATSRPLNYARLKKKLTKEAETYNSPDFNTLRQQKCLTLNRSSSMLNTMINNSRGTTAKSKNLQTMPTVEMGGRIRPATPTKVTMSPKINTTRGNSTTMDRRLTTKTHNQSKTGSSRTPTIKISSRLIINHRLRPITSILLKKECRQILPLNTRTLLVLTTQPLTRFLVKNKRKNKSSLRLTTGTICSDYNSRYSSRPNNGLTMKFSKNCLTVCQRLRQVGQLKTYACLKTIKYRSSSKRAARTARSSTFSSRPQ